MVELDIVRGGQEALLNNLEEGLIIVDESSREVLFANDAAKKTIYQTSANNESLFDQSSSVL